MSVTPPGIQAAFRISQKYWKGYPDPEKMVTEVCYPVRKK